MTGNALGDFLVILVLVLAGVAVAGLALIGFVAWRYRIPLRGIVAMGGALLYLVSPVDVLPEGLFGPFGLVDDAGVVGVTALFVYRLYRAGQMLRDAGVDLRRPPRTLRRTPHRTTRLSDPVPPRPAGMPRPARGGASPYGQDRTAPRTQDRTVPRREPGDPGHDAPDWGTPPPR